MSQLPTVAGERQHSLGRISIRCLETAISNEIEDQGDVMKIAYRKSLLTGATLCLAANGTFAQTVASASDEASATARQLALEEVVVTAQKRLQSINEVPMSIAAVSADELSAKGFSDTEDLIKVVPGFTTTRTNSFQPVYSLRGVGLYLYDSGVGASPAVSVYLDEAGLPSPAMTSGVSFDLERIEVLKGPQGTLFGQNATGGAINFIAAKPTKEFSSGITVSLDEYGKVDTEGFISGPLTDKLQGRLAIGTVQGGAWQESVTRPGDELGDKDQLQARLLLNWQATDDLSFLLNATTATDKSDTVAAQFTQYHPNRVVGGVHPDPVAHVALFTTPVFGNNSNPEDADWTPGTNKADNKFDFYSLRADYSIGDAATLTSLTTYQEIEIDMLVDQDGSAVHHLNINPKGSAETFSQELRVAGDTDRINWVVGLNYEQSDISNNLYYDQNLAAQYALGPALFYRNTFSENTSDVEAKAVFANIEYKLTPQLTAQAGVRYTDSSRDATSCTYGNDDLAAFVNAITTVLGPGSAGFVAGDCIMLETSAGPNAVPTGAIVQTLDEDNTSWRAGLTYATQNDTILYGNVSRGYKAGTIIPAGGLTRDSYTPTTQEELTAYEIGFKAPLLHGRAQLNGAAFFYDYKDKQVPTVVPDPAFRQLPALANVPKSEITGAELQFIAVLAEGLDLSLSATYLDTEVIDDFVVSTLTGSANAKGSVLPNTPELSLAGDLQYRWNLSSNVDMFVGGGVTYVDETLARFQDSLEPAPMLPAYTVVDLRAGLISSNDTWKIQVWGRNVGDELYFTSSNNSVDTSYRYAGQGATYGLTFSYRM